MNDVTAMKGIIGIAGGAGPFAGADLFRKIIGETQATRDQDHVPVVLLSFPELIPDRTEYLLGKEKRNPGMAIARIFLQLEKAGATVAAVSCNTAHAPVIFNEVLDEMKQAGSGLKVLHMIEETAAYIETLYKGATIGILSTTGTRQTGIYKQAFEKKEIRVLETDAGAPQEKVHQAVYDPEYGIKACSSPVKNKAKNTLLEAAQDLITKGAEVIVLGCTEIPLAIPETRLGQVPLVDPNRILAQALIRAVNPGKLGTQHPG